MILSTLVIFKVSSTMPFAPAMRRLPPAFFTFAQHMTRRICLGSASQAISRMAMSGSRCLHFSGIPPLRLFTGIRGVSAEGPAVRLLEVFLEGF